MDRYLDSSALVKVVTREPESERLATHLKRSPGAMLSSALSIVEVGRALARAGQTDGEERCERLFSAVDVRSIDDEILRAATAMPAADLRSLDAIHLATALELGAELDEFVAYDVRLLEAAERAGLRTASP